MKSDHAFLPRAASLSPHRWPETEFDPHYEAFLQAHLAHWGSEECVVLPKFAVNALRTVANWRRGANAVGTALPAGTPIATFMDRKGRPSDLWDGGEGLGLPGNFTSHAGVLAGYLRDAGGAVTGLKIWEVYPGAGRVRRRIYPLDDHAFGTLNARAYHAILDLDRAPLGGKDNPYFGKWLETIPGHGGQVPLRARKA